MGCCRFRRGGARNGSRCGRPGVGPRIAAQRGLREVSEESHQPGEDRLQTSCFARDRMFDSRFPVSSRCLSFRHAIVYMALVDIIL